MTFYNTMRALIISVTLVQITTVYGFWSRTEKPLEQVQQEVMGTYKKVYHAYADICNAYDLIQEATPREAEHYTRNLIDLIVYKVKHDQLPLYGGVLNKFWRTLTAQPLFYPLSKFENTLIHDSIGHMHKAYSQVCDRGLHNTEIEHFIGKLRRIQDLVRSCVDHRMEQALLERDQAKAELYELKQLLAREQEERKRAELSIKRQVQCSCLTI